MTALVLTRDRPTEIRRLVGCLAQQSTRPDEVIIIDNNTLAGKLDELVEDALKAGVTVRVTRPGSPVGTATGRNMALAQAASDLCLLLDDDLIFHAPDVIDSLVTMFEQRPRLGGVTFKVRAFGPGSDLRRRLVERAFDTAKLLFFLRGVRPGSVSRSHFQADMRTMSGSGRVEWLQGGASMVRTSLAVAVGFDPRLELRPFAIAEDVDFGFRLSRVSDLEYRSDIESFNGHSRPGGTGGAWLTPAEKAYVTVRNYALIRRKNRPGRLNAAAWAWSMVGMGLYLALMARLEPSSDHRSSLAGWRLALRSEITRSSHE